MNDLETTKAFFSMIGIELENYKIAEYLYLLEADNKEFINSMFSKFHFNTYYSGMIRIEFNKDYSLKKLSITDIP